MAEPFASRIRPRTLDDIVGQQHLLGDGKPLRRIIESGQIPNLIFYGPSGVGKTTVANLIAQKSNKKLYRMNATHASTADIKQMLAACQTLDGAGGILLYLDEIQYFTKKQQQTLLECTENGDVTLIASTTENPYFYVYNAILSRSTVFEFKQLTAEDVAKAVTRAFAILEQESGAAVNLEPGVVQRIAAGSGGDVRKALNALELCFITADVSKSGERLVTMELAQALSQRSAMRYDREGDDHYDIVSAYQKSMRGSDPDAALHYLARLLEAGDLPSACRRLMVCACEDVGLAYPQVIPIVKAAVDAALMLGLPEARIPLADAVVLVATAPKSNAAYLAVDAALADLRQGKSGPIPRSLQNKHFDGADAKVKGQHYKYAHDYPNHYVQQQYLPDALKGTVYYRFGDNKNEQAFEAYWRNIKKKNGQDT